NSRHAGEMSGESAAGYEQRRDLLPRSQLYIPAAPRARLAQWPGRAARSTGLLATGTLADHWLLWPGDGRITAGRLAAPAAAPGAGDQHSGRGDRAAPIRGMAAARAHQTLIAATEWMPGQACRANAGNSGMQPASRVDSAYASTLHVRIQAP